MLIRDKIAKKIEKENKDLARKLRKINSSEEFVQELLKKIQYDFDQFKITGKEESLAEMDEGIEFLKMAMGMDGLYSLREELKEKFGLYWDQMKLGE